MQNLNFCYQIEMIDIGKLNLNSFIWFLFDNEVLSGAGVESRTQESVRVESHFD